MRKINNYTAFEVLRMEKRHTLFWFAAFIVAFTVVILDRLTEKVVR